MMAGMDMFGGKALAIGSLVDAAPARKGLCIPGASRWYALTVAPQREAQAEHWLKVRGVYSFYPVIRCKTRVRGVVRDYDRRYLPGLLFARFKGEPLPHEVLACSWVTGAVCRADRQWGVLDPSALRGLYTMRRIDVAAKVSDAAMRARGKVDRMIAKGSRAMFRTGPFAGFECEVVEVKADGGARVALSLFGREALLTTGESDLIIFNEGD